MTDYSSMHEADRKLHTIKRELIEEIQKYGVYKLKRVDNDTLHRQTDIITQKIEFLIDAARHEGELLERYDDE